MILKNLQLLKKSMEENGWCIDSFLFNYNKSNYIVLVKLYDPKEERPQYALLKLEFLKQDDIQNKLLVPANSYRLMVETKKLREYFGLKYGENIGEIMKQFSVYFSKYIPTKVINNKNDIQKKVMCISLNKDSSENPNKIYCYKVKRNSKRADGTLRERSVYNDNKTRILRPELYEVLGIDKNLSFCYYENPEDEKSDTEIILNWTKRKNI